MALCCSVLLCVHVCMCVCVCVRGRGNSSKFWYIEHQNLTAKIEFELKHNNDYVQAAGNVWKRPGCIPMGGSFSAQLADLHCQWEVYQNRHLFRELAPQITASGYVCWETEWGVLSLCQFRDNIYLPHPFQTVHVERLCDMYALFSRKHGNCWSCAPVMRRVHTTV